MRIHFNSSRLRIPQTATLALFNLSSATGSLNTDAGTGIQALANRILQIIIVFAYPLAFIAIVYSAYQLITSMGKPDAYASAKKNITYVFIGIFLVIFAGIIVRFFISVFGNNG